MQTSFVQAGDTRLQYFEHGSGPVPIVFVHGFSASGRIWRLTQEALDTDAYRSIALSNRGAGDSDRGDRAEDYSVEAFAVCLHEAVQALGLRDIVLVGHSLGGATATRFALDHQDLLRALVLLNPVPLDGDGWHTGWRDELQASFDAALRLAQPPAGASDHQREMQGDTRRNPPERATGGLDSMAALKLRSRLHEISVPTLVVGGDRDELVGVNNILAEYLALPAALRSLHVFHSVGHSPNTELPQRLAGTISRFLGGLQPS